MKRILDGKWYVHSPEQVAEALDTDMSNGLSSETARQRLIEYGPNELEEQETRTIWDMLFDQFKEPLVLILIAAAAISAFLGEGEDTVVILLIVVLNAVLGVFQENRAENSLAALKQLSAPQARVVRDGKVQDIAARLLVPGDLLLLEAGARVSADARLIEAVNLKCEEAALTGESVPAEKSVETIKEEDVGVGDRTNMVFSGTSVTYGRGRAIVTETAMRTEIGKIAAMIRATPREATPLQRRLEELGKTLGLLALTLVVIVFIAGLMRGEPALEMFMTSVSLAVAAIPEGLPAIVTIVLALGVQRMIQRQAIIRKLPAVETLGTATVVVSDKTGTLTQNEMMVSRLYVGGRTLVVTGQGYKPEGKFLERETGQEVDPLSDSSINLLLHGATLVNDARLDRDGDTYKIIGDPTEGALTVLGAKAGIQAREVNSIYPRVGEIPFDSRRKRMTTFHPIKEKGGLAGIEVLNRPFISFTKGAPDVILSLCSHIYVDGEIRALTGAEREKLLDVNASMGEDALRVLAVAFRLWDELPRIIAPDSVEKELVFVGFAGMIDPPRAEVKDAVAVAKRAGIRPIMVTGDHKVTALAIARELGIWETDKDKVVSGTELEHMTDAELREIIEDVRVFARVSPEHKVRIVEALKARGHVVAVTGDGVNDAPALKRADIGAAMGITGTDVSKEAAEMVLADDNFATIVAAVREGRTIFANIKKSIHYLLSCNVGEIFSIFLAIILGLGRPLTAIQILWVNLVTDGFPALALGVEPAEAHTMDRPPRDPKEGIFAGGMSARIFIQGSFIGLLALLAYYIGRAEGIPVEMARTMAFATLAFSQLFQALNTRSEQSLFKIGLFSNRYMVYAFFASAALQLVVLFLPPLRSVFDVAPLDFIHWDVVIGLSILPIPFGEVYKLIERRCANQ